MSECLAGPFVGEESIDSVASASTLKAKGRSDSMRHAYKGTASCALILAQTQLRRVSYTEDRV